MPPVIHDLAPESAPPRTSSDRWAAVGRLGDRVWSRMRRRSGLQSLYRRGPLTLRRSVHYLRYYGRLPRLVRPRTLNEKVNWRICFDRRELLSWTCDKLRMKQEAQRRDPGIAVPATLWQGTDLAELAALPLPDRWVLKANHSSQLVHLGAGRPSVAELEQVTRGWLTPSYQETVFGEWAYQQAEVCLLVEEWIGDDDGAPPADLKFLCFDGRVAVIQVHLSRYSDHTVAFYDPSWRRLPVTASKTPPAPEIPAPRNLAQLLEHAQRLSAGFDFIRVDLYDTDRGVVFGEFTPYPASGLVEFEPAGFDRYLGDLWTLPRRR
ncbi:ATP-grasp fold amidoligase family protein [uncultured Cellulomonas sp.]|uniref:ATP-grasp fold amidoligase family protein n=1 Tax=uncultured Cellulomonas sp. TaxID=189682 RepID=UPI0026310FC5|nr:ATP-grasp fold amidoligase family protein [uncultured Cellulomonas sp.]